MVVFNFKINSVSNVITNSSSELFVFNDNDSVENVISILDNIYPDWRDEYADPIRLKDCDNDDFETYCHSCILDVYMSDISRYHNRNFDVIEDAKWQAKVYKEFLQKSLDYAGIDLSAEEAFLNLDNAYKSFLPWDHPDREYYYAEFSQKLKDKILEKYGDDILLFSHDENPNWEYQEKLMEVAERYHLG